MKRRRSEVVGKDIDFDKPDVQNEGIGKDYIFYDAMLFHVPIEQVTDWVSPCVLVNMKNQYFRNG